ncbi:MAG: T9SS type A sorting domain-containing protein [Bacteroidetes bacterium]|nr:T9SS type A sorting domain-containing protein [Bacteroidota bacterium]
MKIVFLLSACLFVTVGFSQNGLPSPENKNPTSLSPLGGNNFLGKAYNDFGCGLNYVQGSVLIETRTQGYGFNANGTGLPSAITISGLPVSSVSIDKAFLWYCASYQSATAPVTTVNITNPSGGNTIYNNLSPVGISGDVCWAEVGSAVYRADVTTTISGNGLYSFDITGFTNPNWEVDGATLLIIYRDSSAAYSGTLVIDDGNMGCGSFNGYLNPLSDTLADFIACDSSSFANAFLIVSDMQANINGGFHTSTLNGVTTTNFSNDFWNFDFINTAVMPGQTTSFISADGLGSDCYNLLVAGLYYQDTNCVSCISTVSVSESSQESAIIVYPNPFSESTALEVIGNQSSVIGGAFIMYDVYGREIYRLPITDNRLLIERGNLSNGLYFYSIESDGKILSRGKLLNH